MSYRIVIDRTICSGYGACADADPVDFRIGPDGIATAPEQAGDARAAQAAARDCPMGAITVLADGELRTR
jgi:ferredoxin